MSVPYRIQTPRQTGYATRGFGKPAQPDDIVEDGRAR